MIRIYGNPFSPEELGSEYLSNPIRRKIVNILNSSSYIYQYAALQDLKFEIDLRLNIVNAAIDFDRSRVTFREFRMSKCNGAFWKRTQNGGFLLLKDAVPSEAIDDIFINGRKYGTECATAIVIIFYKGLLDTMGKVLFNKLFPSIFLMDWLYAGSNFDIKRYENPKDYLPGDCRYFINPDVSMLFPEWRGENVIDLGNGTFFGHGIGIKTADSIIRSLNRRRKIGASTSAYLLDSVNRLDIQYFSRIYYNWTKKTGS